MKTFIVDYEEYYAIEVKAKNKAGAIKKAHEEIENNIDNYFRGGDIVDVTKV